MSERVLMAHGGGGEMTGRLIAEHILPRLGNPVLDHLTDGAVLDRPAGRVVMATDASVVQPLFFPGGDIGRLAISGTVNDLAVMGATPLALTTSLIIEEGLTVADLDRVLDALAATAAEAGVQVVAGDTKVVERGRGDGLTIATAGIGVVPDDVELGLTRIRSGDRLVVTGPIADHGLAIMASREGLAFDTPIRSDVAPLADLCRDLVALGPVVRFLRDPTRGGLAGVLADIAAGSACSVEVSETAIPINPATRHAAEMLGLDPLAVANEGKLVVACAPESEAAVLDVCHRHPRARRAAVIGAVVDRHPPLVELITAIGGRRIVQRPYGEELPRIC